MQAFRVSGFWVWGLRVKAWGFQGVGQLVQGFRKHARGSLKQLHIVSVQKPSAQNP